MDKSSILIVDDNKDFADVFCDILRTNNYTAESCYSGKEALDILKNNKFDIIFLDIMMPDMDGVETLKRIRKNDSKTTIVMMTGYSLDDMVHKAIEEKASEIIYKPFEIDKVLDLVKTIV